MARVRLAPLVGFVRPRRTRALVALAAAIGAAACGDGASETADNGDVAPRAERDGGAEAEAGPDASHDGPAAPDADGGLIGQCASGIVCGAGACCAAGEECIADACRPACASAVRCGVDLAVCCGAGQYCVSGACVPPGHACLDWADCDEDQFCEPTLGLCLGQPASGPTCRYEPPTAPLTPTLEWSWTGSTVLPSFDQVIEMPVVVDLDHDGTPEVVIVTSDGFDASGRAYLRALDGKTGFEKWDAAADAYQSASSVQPRVTPAAADLDGDGSVEIVAGKMGGGLVAFDHDGHVRWVSRAADGTTPWNGKLESAAIAIADLEGDGHPEVVVGGAVFESSGTLRFDGGLLGSNGTYGAVSIVADLDGAFPQEIVGGKRALRSDGSLYWDDGQADGYPAIADLDGDGTPEIVVVSGGKVRVHAPTTGAVLASLAMPGTGSGGPPTIADFDADGTPEIGAANGNAYSVFEYVSSPAPALSVKWQQATQDLSSNRTGSSVFDFQGDGESEVVYNDECYLRVYAGSDGAVQFEIPNSSATIHEYPVTVDVDGDNNTEIVVVANDANHVKGSPSCPYGAAGARHGVFVYGDAADRWVRTRRIWNQHAYHGTNVDSAGGVPAPEPASWIAPAGLNDYRRSSQGAGVFNAPDLQLSLEASLGPCPTAVELRARVQNLGSLGVPANVPVRFYRGTSAAGTFVATAQTQKPLLPGQSEVVTALYTIGAGDAVMSFHAVVDADAAGEGAVDECDEANNTASLDGVRCGKVN